MRRLWRLWLPMLAIVVISIAAACGGDDDDDDAAAVPSGIDAAQVLTVYLGGEPDTLDPQRATDTVSIAVLRQIYSTLLSINQELTVEADLAKEVPTVENGGISADGLTYTFKLRDGLTWSDGTPLKAQAFVDGAKRLFDPGSGNYYVDFYRVLAASGNNAAVEEALGEGVEGAELEALENAVVANLEVSAPDDQTVVYRLNRRSPVFLLLTTMWPLYPVRLDVINQHGDQWTEAGNLIANGRFVLSEWNHDQSITLTRNEQFHGQKPILQTINIGMESDSAIAFLAYGANEYDITVLGPEELVQVRGTDFEREFQKYPQLVTIGIYFNVERGALTDVKVRQALAGAIDRDEYAEIVAEGAVLPAYSWVPPGMPGHDPETGLQYQNALERSKQLLEEAGYPDGSGLEFEILSSDTSGGKRVSEWLQEQWESKLGATVSINLLEVATYFAERNSGNYEVVTGGWGADYPDPQNWMPLFKTGGLLNSGNFSNAEFDALITAADDELDNEKRIQLYKDAQVIMIEEMPFAPLYYRRRNILVKPWVQGLVTSSMESNIPGDLFFGSVFIRGRN